MEGESLLSKSRWSSVRLRSQGSMVKRKFPAPSALGALAAPLYEEAVAKASRKVVREVEQLRAALDEHSHRYYVLDDPIISAR